MSGAELAAIDLDERAFDRMMTRAKVFARFPGLPEQISDNPEACAGIMLSLAAYGLQPTLPAIKGAFHWIEGKAEPSARLYQALAYRYGYDLKPLVRERDRAVARIRTPRGDESDWEYNLEDAIASHRRDEWVEDWHEPLKQGGKRWKSTWIVRINGVETETDLEPTPPWAVEKVKQGQVKRYDAWWNYRKDMMWKSAAKRAVDGKASHLLLGAGAWLAEDRLPERRDFIDVQPVEVHPSQPGPGAGAPRFAEPDPRTRAESRGEAPPDPAGDTLFEADDDRRPLK
jgi:hypothetical protein